MIGVSGELLMRQYNFAVIGNGYMARRHIKCIDGNPRTSVKLVINRHDVVRNNSGADAPSRFGTDDALFSFLKSHEGIDVVLVSSPDSTHAAYVSALLDGRQTILCEKPLARTEQEFRTIFKAAGAGTGKVIVGMNVRFRKRIQHLKQVVHSGTLGRVVFVNASYYSNITPIVTGTTKTWWAEYPKGIRPFLHGGAVHLFDALRFVIGEIDEVLCIPVSNGSSHRFGGDTFAIMMKCSGGALLNVSVAGGSLAPNRFEILVEGKSGSVDASFQYTRDAAGGMHMEALPEEDFQDLDRHLLHVLDVLDGKADPLNSLDEAYKNFRVISACEESLSTASWARASSVPVRSGETSHG